MAVWEAKGAKRLLKKHFHGEGGRFGKSQQKLSLARLPIFPHSFASAPPDLFIFLWLW
jgi:hypothetical protein